MCLMPMFITSSATDRVWCSRGYGGWCRRCFRSVGHQRCTGHALLGQSLRTLRTSFTVFKASSAASSSGGAIGWKGWNTSEIDDSYDDMRSASEVGGPIFRQPPLVAAPGEVFALPAHIETKTNNGGCASSSEVFFFYFESKGPCMQQSNRWRMAQNLTSALTWLWTPGHRWISTTVNNHIL